MSQVAYRTGIAGAEAAMRQAGVDRYLNRQAKLTARGTASERDDYSKIIKDNLLDFADRLDVMIDNDKAQRGRQSKLIAKFKGLESVTIAYLALATTLSAIKGFSDQYKLATKIGKAIESEVRFHQCSKENPPLLARLVLAAKQRGSYRHKAEFVFNTAAKEGIVPDQWDVEEQTLIGTKMLKISVEMGLVTMETTTRGTLRETKVSLSEEMIGFLAEHRAKAEDGSIPMVSPVLAPMTQTPRDWTSCYAGGYEFLQLGLIKKKNAVADYENADLTKVFRSVNIMQHTAWRINPVMLVIVEAFWSQGIEVGKLPVCIEQPVPDRLSDETWTAMSVDEQKAHRLNRRELRESNRKAGAQMASIGMVLAQAKMLQDAPAIYLPYELDNRGRAYCLPLLNPQGPDYVRSLFEFANGKPVGEQGGMWLALQAASLWDGQFRGRRLSKASFQDRHDWVDENEVMIRAIVENPLDDTRWQEADKPFMFLRTCMDLVGYWDHGPEYVACVPIALDGSCSGIQHYAAQLRNVDCARSVNLLPNDAPADVYSEVAEAVLASVKSDTLIPRIEPPTAELLTSEQELSPCEFWLAHGITRKVVKTPVMTYGYSSREAGFTDKYEHDFVRPALKEMGRADKPNPIARYLAKKTLAAVEDRLAPVKQGMDWLMICADLLAAEGKGISWTAPTGFPVTQKYMDIPSIRVETYLEGEKLRVSVPGKPKKIIVSKQKSAISPNFVHSLDAAHLMFTVLEAHDSYGITDFALIHDSFGTLPADADGMFAAVRDAFVDMYTQHDPFQELYERVKADLSEKGREKLPEPPAMGDLDLEEVRQSLYAFA